MLLSQLLDQLLDSLVPLMCSLFGVLYSGRMKSQQAVNCLQEPKDLITIIDLGTWSGQVASFFTNCSMCI